VRLHGVNYLVELERDLFVNLPSDDGHSDDQQQQNRQLRSYSPPIARACYSTSGEED
jgi:hypothetical protein